MQQSPNKNSKIGITSITITTYLFVEYVVSNATTSPNMCHSINWITPIHHFQFIFTIELIMIYKCITHFVFPEQLIQHHLSIYSFHKCFHVSSKVSDINNKTTNTFMNLKEFRKQLKGMCMTYISLNIV